ncbi:hypothetical protein ABFV05_015347 [Capra hircus]
MDSIPGPGKFHTLWSDTAHAPQLWGPPSRAGEPLFLKPVRPEPMPATRETAAVRSACASAGEEPRSPQLEEARAQQRPKKSKPPVPSVRTLLCASFWLPRLLLKGAGYLSLLSVVRRSLAQMQLQTEPEALESTPKGRRGLAEGAARDPERKGPSLGPNAGGVSLDRRRLGTTAGTGDKVTYQSRFAICNLGFRNVLHAAVKTSPRFAEQAKGGTRKEGFSESLSTQFECHLTFPAVPFSGGILSD